jgi:hypothetical protein
MPTQPRSAAEHYSAAERLLAAAPEEPSTAVLAAICHAVLATVPKKQLRGRHSKPYRGNDLPPSLSWGDDKEGRS